LGPNLGYINELIDNPRIAVEGGQVTVEPLFCSDLAALRHTEHVAASGWCGCSRDVALRRTPKEKPSNAAELATFLKQCRCMASVWCGRTHLRATRSAEVKGPRTGEEKPRLPLRHGSPLSGGFGNRCIGGFRVSTLGTYIPTPATDSSAS